MITVNEYRRATGNTYTLVGSNYRLLSANQITHAIPTNANNEIFTVYMLDGSKFITDAAGITALGNNLVQANEYTRSSGKLKRTGLKFRVCTRNVATMYPAGVGYDVDGTTEINCVRIRLTNSKFLITDESGISAIQSEWC